MTTKKILKTGLLAAAAVGMALSMGACSQKNPAPGEVTMKPSSHVHHRLKDKSRCCSKRRGTTCKKSNSCKSKSGCKSKNGCKSSN